jgi:predicted Fe-S protein YdhL (DUF1289 family)
VKDESTDIGVGCKRGRPEISRWDQGGRHSVDHADANRDGSATGRKLQFDIARSDDRQVSRRGDRAVDAQRLPVGSLQFEILGHGRSYR